MPRENEVAVPQARTLGATSKTSAVLSVLNISELTQNRRFVCDKRERVLLVTCMFSYQYLYVIWTIMFTGLLQKDLLKGR